MQNTSITVNSVQAMQQSRTDYAQYRSTSATSATSDLSKTSSVRHSMDAPLESPASRYEPSLDSTLAANTAIVDANAPPAYDDNKSEIRTSTGGVSRMSKREYAMEISKMMGKQLVRSVNGQKTVRD